MSCRIPGGCLDEYRTIKRVKFRVADRTTKRCCIDGVGRKIPNQNRKINGSHRQISDRLGISTGCIGVLLQRARGKLDGTYHDGLRLDINRKRREYVLKNPEKEKESRKKSYRKNREKRIEDMREYNKQYYQKHRIEILHKKKEMRFKSEEKS